MGFRDYILVCIANIHRHRELHQGSYHFQHKIRSRDLSGINNLPKARAQSTEKKINCLKYIQISQI